MHRAGTRKSPLALATRSNSCVARRRRKSEWAASAGGGAKRTPNFCPPLPLASSDTCLALFLSMKRMAAPASARTESGLLMSGAGSGSSSQYSTLRSLRTHVNSVREFLPIDPEMY